MFKKVLIANRGVIAVRIIRTLRKMGIASVAVYTETDRDSLHVEQADEALLIGEGPAKTSYLNAELILSKALEAGVDAIHPGYGFLSENVAFAEACRENGIAFIGPDPENIRLFGLKHTARAIAEQAGVPLLPGTGLISNLEEAVRKAAEIGYPVMLKSTAGGGGIGMRICSGEEALVEAFDSVTRLAAENFNDGGVFLEKYIARARHIEVQIFGDGAGNAVALGERDCSVQRRNQKIIEETPAPLLAEETRRSMHESARKLAAEAKYRNAGTVEFLYDSATGLYYFLEVNTRLQVEHGITEEVFGVDLVEWMVLEAAGVIGRLQERVNKPQGHSLQVRLYAEDCHHDFRPSDGRIDGVVWPEGTRVETWIQPGLQVTTLYDPMLAKLIVHADTRSEAIQAMIASLEQLRVYGITTNQAYIAAFLGTDDFCGGRVFTNMLGGYSPAERAIEVLDGGVQTTVQDYPGRTGYWDIGVPPSGPMDTLAFRMGNRLLGNSEQAAGLEMTLRGGSYRFRGDIRFVLAGADMDARLDGTPVAPYTPLQASAGAVLTLGESALGMRSYLLVAGGFDMPLTLGSASTFTLGGFGGYGGGALRPGSVLRVNPGAPLNRQEQVRPLPEVSQPDICREWAIGVIPGPHCTEEYLLPAYLEQLTGTVWEVHFNSSRTGVRLIGPAPLWAREDGGDAGLHPSNIHDNAYAIGALDLTGDMPILLGPDGPSLGGFVCPVTTASAELWKIGQLRPGDKVRFKLITVEEAEQLRLEQELFLKELGEEQSGSGELKIPALPEQSSGQYMPLLAFEEQGRRFKIAIRCSGDENILVEYGDRELDLLYRFQVYVLMQAVKDNGRIPYIEMTPGIRSLQIHLDRTQITVKEAAAIVLDIDLELPSLDTIEVPSRKVKLPLSWDDPATRLAIERYQQNVRPDAPWCPSNLEFIRRMNGLESIDEVAEVVFNASYLVMGLGDVYLGAPVAVPLDPRHRLVTTKYNPARTWTPENAVGIGGAYLCVYGMEGPGGYQFVGRTVQMWNKFRETANFEPGKPWLLRFFDQITFYPVSEAELLQMREDFPRGAYTVEVEETTFNLGQYLTWLDSIEQEAAEFRSSQQSAFQQERELWKELGIAEHLAEAEAAAGTDVNVLPEGSAGINSLMPGSVWKVIAEPGQRVQKGETIIIEESMKMEFPQTAPFAGIIANVFVSPGDQVRAGDLIAAIYPEQEEAAS
ncbi:urea carboxylase [Paenibacillus sp. DMB5]|uniref:urea carboxylase n=1 Tax=Paenibacillus sp. DMB5 TaxID=1780103 RepID=UPI00076D05B6|nr:urea carboxylase [Paenibacillus sp. DMB5]KUP21771.1 urea carboxylase [Paenibacillus sp. DMB5]